MFPGNVLSTLQLKIITEILSPIYDALELPTVTQCNVPFFKIIDIFVTLCYNWLDDSPESRSIKKFKENAMRLSPPKVITFWISVALGLLGLLGGIGVVGALAGGTAFWLTFAGLALLAVSLMVEGL